MSFAANSTACTHTRAKVHACAVGASNLYNCRKNSLARYVYRVWLVTTLIKYMFSPSVCLSVGLSVCLSACLSVCPSVRVSFSLCLSSFPSNRPNVLHLWLSIKFPLWRTKLSLTPEPRTALRCLTNPCCWFVKHCDRSWDRSTCDLTHDVSSTRCFVFWLENYLLHSLWS